MIESIFVALGSFFVLTTAIGMVRFPDFFCRMHAASKVTSFGIGFLLLAVIAKYPSVEVVTKSFLCILFVMLTMPVAAHVLTRVAYHLRVESSDETLLDEYHMSYKPEKVSDTVDQ